MARTTIASRVWTWALALVLAVLPAAGAVAAEIDHSTPEKLLESFFAAVAEGDYEAAVTALHPDERENANMDEAPEGMTHTLKQSRIEGDWALLLIEVSYDGKSQAWPTPATRIDGKWYLVASLGTTDMPDWIHEQSKAWEVEDFLNDPDVIELKLDTPIEVTLTGDSPTQYKLVLPADGIVRIEAEFDTEATEGIWVSLNSLADDISASSDATPTGAALEADASAGTYRVSIGSWGEELTLSITVRLYSDGEMPEGSVAWDLAEPLKLMLAAGEACSVYMTLSADQLYLFARKSEDTEDGYFNMSLWRKGEHIAYGSDFLLGSGLEAGRYRLTIHSQGDGAVELTLTAKTPDQITFHDIAVGKASEPIKVTAAEAQFAQFVIEEAGLYTINTQYEYGDFWLQSTVFFDGEQVTWGGQALEELQAGRHVLLLQVDASETDVRVEIRRVGSLTEGSHKAALEAGLPMAFRLTLAEERAVSVAAVLDAEASLDLSIQAYDGGTLVADSNYEGKVSVSITLPAGDYIVHVGISDWSDVSSANLTLEYTTAAPAPLTIPDGAQVVKFGGEAVELAVSHEPSALYLELTEARMVEIEVQSPAETYVSVELRRRDFPLDESSADSGTARIVIQLEAGVYNLQLSSWGEETTCSVRVGSPPQLVPDGETLSIELAKYSRRLVQLTVTEAGTYTITAKSDGDEGVNVEVYTTDDSWITHGELDAAGASVATADLEPGTYTIWVYSQSDTSTKATIAAAKD